MAAQGKGPIRKGGIAGELKTDSELLVAKQLARAYVPFQRYTERFDVEEGLLRGTIFPELWVPYGPAEK